MAPPALSITLNYPGASAQVVEETAVALVEQEMNGIEHLLYMESSSELGIGTITLTFEAGTNLDVASVETQNRIKRAEARLPDDVRRVGVTVAKSARNLPDVHRAHLAGQEPRQRGARQLMPPPTCWRSIRRVPGVGEAILFGTEYSMRLWLKPDKLQSYNLSPGDVSAAVRAQNTQLATGELGQLPAAPGQQLNAVIVTRSRLEHAGRIRQHHRARQSGRLHRARQGCGARGTRRTGLLHRRPHRRTTRRGHRHPSIARRPMRWIPPRRSRPRWRNWRKFFPKGVDWVVPYDTSQFVEISITRSGEDTGGSHGAGVPGDLSVPGEPARHLHSQPSSCRSR